ncbi:hypothetical protein PUW24_02825 [Paenibacillus urinalis]|uniref:Uncharacterized protein n=1 Tax=Paenibacillus urinalis TaxID=521520 RepID=A0AAX3MX17_9BACL|nr:MULTISPECIES: hypothetical protein [Paenibacillus]OMC64871.1 hypothetical protein BK126_24230 [Paenibacillus sp. FSL H7-0326]WDH81883.1 hypothetical protein PUW23_20670 [Paenibacillus urinalis]WDH97933.1 hypothetical protein PUW24_02825 [Paenibacillus urinalis]WDI01612.1 hypothetical protein PUW25_20560 [Paenibacillus urinalis]GAK42590.1 hypothetical protein TCA2_5082 [Paenibacillus sp. TCA20]
MKRKKKRVTGSGTKAGARATSVRKKKKVTGVTKKKLTKMTSSKKRVKKRLSPAGKKRQLRKKRVQSPRETIAAPEYKDAYSEGFNAGFAQGFEDGHKLAYEAQ